MSKNANIASDISNLSQNAPEGEIKIEDLRKVKGFENLTDAEAQRLLRTLKRYCSFIHDCFTQTKANDQA